MSTALYYHLANSSFSSHQWSLAFLGRLVFSAVGMLMIQWYPRGAPMSTSYYMFVIVSTVISSFMSTVQFVSISAFMTSIADPLIGGTYMTVRCG